MDKLDEIQNLSAIFDIRAETFAATLLANSGLSDEEIDIEQIIVSAIGSARRRVAHDVQEVKKKYFDSDEALYINVNRKGMFDTLPERLFLRLEEKYDDPIKRTKAIKTQIADARKFFLPYEQAMYHAKIETEMLEQKYTESFPEFLKDIWGLPKFKNSLNERQRFLLCYLLPEAHRVVGDWDLTGLIFESVLQKPVDFGFSAPRKLETPEVYGYASDMKLGETSIMGDYFYDDVPTLEITVRGISNNDLVDFLPGGKNRIVLEELLCSYFIPLDVPVITKFSVTEDSLDFNLGEQILGYNVQFN